MPPVMNRTDSQERCRRAWELSLRGRSWPEIAAAEGFKSRQSARKAVANWLRKNPPDDVDILRRATGDTLTLVIRKVLDSLDAAQAKGDHRGVAELGRVVMDGLDKRAKLEGLHIAVPQQVEVNVHQSPAEVIASTRERLLAVLQAEQAAIGQTPAVQPEIFDAEIIDTTEEPDHA